MLASCTGSPHHQRIVHVTQAVNGKHNHISCTIFGPLSNRSEAHVQYNADVVPDSPANDHHTGNSKVIQFSTRCRYRAQVALPGAMYVHACRCSCFAGRSTPGMWPMQTCMGSDTVTASRTMLASTCTGINSRHASNFHVDMHMQMHIQVTWLQTFKSGRRAHTHPSTSVSLEDTKHIHGGTSQY